MALTAPLFSVFVLCDLLTEMFVVFSAYNEIKYFFPKNVLKK